MTIRKVLLCMVFPLAFASLVFASQVDRNFSFIIFGDNRQSSSSTISQPEIFKKLIQEVNLHRDEVAFCVNLGDIINGNFHTAIYKLQMDEYLNSINKLKIPIYHVPGNHEIRESLEKEKIYKERIGKIYYSFKYKDCLFIILDTEEIGHEGNIEGNQLLWLEKELHKDASMKFIFLHRPFFPVYHSSKMEREKFNQLLTLFKDNKVNAIFAGHDHFFHKNIHDGILQVISGGAGAPLYTPPPSGIKKHHYCIVTVTGDNMQVKMVPVEKQGK